MGRKQDMVTAVGEERKTPRIIYSTFSVSGDKIPQEIKDAKVGDMCRLEIIVKKIQDGIETYAEGRPQRIELELHKLGYLSSAGKKNFEEYDKMSDEDKEKYDKEDVEEGEKE